jgi:beta-alanine--pyruvate transaminase
MPFTGNREFLKKPRIFKSASGFFYRTADGREILDAASGLWCSGLGHGHPKIVEAIRDAAGELDYVPAFQIGHPLAFELANRITDCLPEPLQHVFYTTSGSEAVDTALKVALAFHRCRGEGARTRLIGRERAYHGAGFGGTSVGGMMKNRRSFGPLLPGVDHLPHTHDLARNAFSRGEPEWGSRLADELQRIVDLHDASTIAAVIVEPVAGSAGVFVPPRGYLRRLREITKRHGILLIFDEVITAFGRLGAGSAAERFDVVPDILTMAKGMTAGTVPMGGIAVSHDVYDAFMRQTEDGIELFHGYTYSGHPLACAAGVAAMRVYEEEDVFSRAAALAPYLEDAVHSLRGSPNVVDVRNIGLMSGIEVATRSDGAGKRGHDVFLQGLDAGVYYRVNGDTIAIAPPLISEKRHVDMAVETLRKILTGLG